MLAPSMVRSSEKITPLKPKSWRKICSSQMLEKPAGCASTCGYTTCAGITAAMPSAARARKGRISAAISSARLRGSSGKTWWLSPETKPWPGKCLPQLCIPPRLSPRCSASASTVTVSAWQWKLRLPITAHCPQSKSNTGVNDKSTPQARNSAANTQPTCSAAASAAAWPCFSQMPPSVLMAGRRVKPSIKRCTRPPS